MELPGILTAEYVNAGNNDPDQLPVLIQTQLLTIQMVKRADPKIDQILDEISKTKDRNLPGLFGQSLATEIGKLSDAHAKNIVTQYLETVDIDFGL